MPSRAEATLSAWYSGRWAGTMELGASDERARETRRSVTTVIRRLSPTRRRAGLPWPMCQLHTTGAHPR